MDKDEGVSVPGPSWAVERSRETESDMSYRPLSYRPRAGLCLTKRLTNSVIRRKTREDSLKANHGLTSTNRH